MSVYRELLYDGHIAQVKGVQFCILSPEEILDRSVVEIKYNETYSGTEPVPHGLFDPRMGVIDHTRVCQTCEQKNTFCPGHFGHIKLARPVFYIQFLDEYVKKLLKCVCFRCSKLLVDKDRPEVRDMVNRRLSRQKRWDHMIKLCGRVRRCGAETTDGCGARVPDKVERTDMMKIVLEWKDLESDAPDEIRRQMLTAEDVLRVFKRITDEECELLGFSAKYNRPEWMVCTVLPVPPPSMRPSVRMDTGTRSEDDLTHKLLDIVKWNNNLQARINKGGSESVEMTSYYYLLQSHVATLVDNNIPHSVVTRDRNGRAHRTLIERLKHKDGRIRGNLMGKRVDYSARTVITPDPNLGTDELGVPLKIAMNLTIPETVNARNVDEMYALVRNGPDVYPGAKNVRKVGRDRPLTQARTIRLKGMNREDVELELGDVVERHLRDGDYVLFNRQPSLHRMSMMAHRVKVMPYNTFRLNVCVCQCYNADFDGDEMNMHVPQSVQTHEEIAALAAVPMHIVSPRQSQIIVNIAQDVPLGVFRITQPWIRVNDMQFANLVCSNPNLARQLDRVIARKALFDGRSVMSTVFPRDLYVRMKGRDDNDESIAIHGGEIGSGVLNSDAFKAQSHGIVHTIYNQHGPRTTTTFLDNTQKLICDWLVLSGFSVGVSDMIIDPGTRAEIRAGILEMKKTVYELLHKIHTNQLENTSLFGNSEYVEREIQGIYNKCINKSVEQKLGKYRSDPENRLQNMINAGSKGNQTNFTQIAACIGQQTIETRRVPYGFDSRTLPHYTRYDDGAESRGFVQNSFIEGLTPQEFFFHSMAGRIGLIDTAVKSVTAETPIVVLEDGRSKYARIGDWIDAHLERRKDRVAHFAERQMEYLELDNEAYIPTTDEDGRVTWGMVTAVTRHDPGTELYRIRTSGGRSVIVTESKSLLTWHPELGKFKEVPTPEIRVGDFLPVTASLMDPPVIVSHVDMADFFPKERYVHGTEFNKAKIIVKAIMDGREKIPVGWWQETNGSVFTLPYPKKARFARVLERSNTDAIRDGFVYPFHAIRETAYFPDRFALDFDNGVFIGLYLAEGNSHDTSGAVCITNGDDGVKSFVKGWFAKYDITCRETTYENQIGGTTSSVIGSSSLVARFLNEFVGKGARNKHVPDVAFVAPVEFVSGLISGYFSGDGTIGKNSVECGSASARLTEGISMLCNRLGIFGKVFTTQTKANNLGTENIAASHRLSIRAQWAQRFAQKIRLIMASKDEQLQAMRATDSHRNFILHNDVVLDEIAEIALVDVADYPKVYDLTVPSTLNFGLANGLQVRDTSETGYLQRKLVKAMEDCKVHWDRSVRNAAGNIVQFAYGDDSMDPIKLEKQGLPYVDWTYERMQQEYLISCAEDLKPYVTPELYEDLSSDRDWERAALEHFLQLRRDRAFLIDKVFKGENASHLSFPINFARLLHYATETARKRVAPISDVHPGWLLEQIDVLCRDLRTRNVGDSWVFAILARMHLSPRQMIAKRKMTRGVMEYVLQQVRAMFQGSLAQPSEMVGIIAAQSIGELTTQTTLNTFHFTGVSSISKNQEGIARLKELVHVTKSDKQKNPVMTISVKAPHDKDMQACSRVMSKIRTTYFKDLVSTSSIYYDPSDAQTRVEQDQALFRTYRLFEEVSDECDEKNKSPWVLRLEFDREKMLEHQVTMIDLNVAMFSWYDAQVYCVFSDDSADAMVMRVRLNRQEIDANDLLTHLKALEYNVLNTLVVKGVKGIERAALDPPNEGKKTYDPDTDSFVSSKSWSIMTNGTNLRDVLAMPDVDASKTVTNDVYEVYTVLGIEAARQALYNEIATMGEFATKVNHRHIALLVDTMTNRGNISSIGVHGINQGDIGPLAKCSFEQTSNKLIQAGVFSEADRINGVAANIILGQVAPCGTGDGEILMDPEALDELPDFEPGGAATMAEVADERQKHAAIDRALEADAGLFGLSAAGASTSSLLPAEEIVIE